jgi:hypothetical protein
VSEVGDLAGAQAKFVVFVASLLHRGDLVRMDEFARLLLAFADSVGETEPQQAQLLSAWAEAVDRTNQH